MTFTPPITRRNHGRGHSYRDANGAKVPGVTTIMNDGLPKPALVNWAAERTAAYALDHWDELAELAPSERLKRLTKARNTERDAAAKRGTQVHKLAEKLSQGEEVDVPDELAGHVEAHLKFLDDWDVQVRATEFVVYSDTYGFAGTGDLIATIRSTAEALEAFGLPGDHGPTILLLLDTKTSKSGVFGETALQLSGYRFADRWIIDGTEIDSYPVDGCAVIWTRSDGYDLVPVEAGPAQFRDLLYVQQVARFTQGSRDLVGEALTPPRLELTA